MKKLLLTPLFVCVFFVNAFGQTDKKHDAVVKTNGDIMTGDVLEITDSTIRFTFSGEKLVYTIKKSDILKITYASGRTETFAQAAAATPSQPATPAQPAASAGEDFHNKVAILPFGFIKDGQNVSPEVSQGVQSECYALLSKHPGLYILESPRATNVKLTKAGITRENILNYSMSDLCSLLGVEYIIDGTVTQNKAAQSNYGSSTYSTTKKDDDKKKTGYESNYSTSVQNYETTMDLKIYNEKSQVIYNQNRKAFWKTEDAYKNTLEYLIKRCPLYSK